VNRPYDPRDSRQRHSVHVPEELGAHALGLLDPMQSRAVEEHLAGCAACRSEWEELRGMVDLLDNVAPEAFLEGPPDADFVLRRTLRQVRVEATRQRRRRRLVMTGVAAAALGVVLASGMQLGRETAPPSGVIAAPAPAPAAPEAAPGDIVLTGGGEPGVSMTATLTPAAGWVRLTADVQGVPAGERCHIMVVARDGTRHIAGSWLVSPSGWREGVSLDGSALVPIDEVAAVVVENEAGREFATARA
jgi:anti-sigma factor RsiW